MANQRQITQVEWSEFLTRISSGETVSEACAGLDISRSSPYRKRARDERFAADWDFAERVSIEVLGDKVLKAAGQPGVVERYDADGTLVERVVKPPNLMQAIRVLERRHPHWKPTSEITSEQSRINIGTASIIDGKLRFGRLDDGA